MIHSALLSARSKGSTITAYGTDNCCVLPNFETLGAAVE